MYNCGRSMFPLSFLMFFFILEVLFQLYGYHFYGSWFKRLSHLHWLLKSVKHIGKVPFGGLFKNNITIAPRMISFPAYVSLSAMCLFFCLYLIFSKSSEINFLNLSIQLFHCKNMTMFNTYIWRLKRKRRVFVLLHNIPIIFKRNS